DHLLLLAEVQRLEMTTPAQIPDMHLVAVFAAEQQVGLKPILDHVRLPPFAGEQGVETKMPPEIIMEKLRAPVHLPLAQHVERLAIQHKDSAGAIAVRSAQRAHVNSFRTAMGGVRA